jgi:hypothetical protein
MKPDRKAAYDRWALSSAVDYAVNILTHNSKAFNKDIKNNKQFLNGLLNVVSAINDETYEIDERLIDRNNQFADLIYRMVSGKISEGNSIEINGKQVESIGELNGLIQIAPTIRYALDENYR